MGIPRRGPARRSRSPIATDTPEFLYWQLASALDRGKRLWTRRLPDAADGFPGAVLPAVPVAGRGPERLLRPPRAALLPRRRPGTRRDRALRRQRGHRDARAGARRPRRRPAGPLGRAALRGRRVPRGLRRPRVDLRRPRGAAARRRRRRRDEAATRPARTSSRAWRRSSAAAVRRRYGDDAAVPRALRDAVNTFAYVDPKTLPDDAPANALSAEPHSFCNVLTGACWDLLVALFRARADSRTAPTALSAAAERSPSSRRRPRETAPSGADFFGRFARRIVREADAATDAGGAGARRGALPPAPARDAERAARARPRRGPRRPRARGRRAHPARPSSRAIAARLPPGPGGEIVTLVDAPRRRTPSARVLRGRRRRDLFLHGPGVRAGRRRGRRDLGLLRARVLRGADSCARRACTRRRRATPRTRAPSSASSRGGGRIADDVEAGAATPRARPRRQVARRGRGRRRRAPPAARLDRRRRDA